MKITELPQPIMKQSVANAADTPLYVRGVQQRQSTPAELVIWFNELAHRVGSGVHHFVTCKECGKDRDAHYDMIYCYASKSGNRFVPSIKSVYIAAVGFERYDSMGKMVERGVL